MRYPFFGCSLLASRSTVEAECSQKAATERSQNDSQGHSTQELPASHDQVDIRSTLNLESVRNTEVSHCLLRMYGGRRTAMQRFLFPW